MFTLKKNNPDSSFFFVSGVYGDDNESLKDVRKVELKIEGSGWQVPLGEAIVTYGDGSTLVESFMFEVDKKD